MLVLTLALILAALSVPSLASAETLTLDSAINNAGRQRMLTQRITKSYLLIGQDVATKKAQEQLDASIALFEEQLGDLESFSPTAEITASLRGIRSQWNHFRQAALATPKRSEALAFIGESNKILALCEKSVQLFEKYAGDKKGELINVAGRQRMLSQRIGMLYAAKSWHIDSEELDKAFDQALSEYDQALKFLAASPLNTNEITTALNEVSSQWEFSRSGFKQIQNGRYVPFVIQVTTESMLKKMNTITGMYVSITDSGLAKY